MARGAASTAGSTTTVYQSALCEDRDRGQEKDYEDMKKWNDVTRSEGAF